LHAADLPDDFVICKSPDKLKILLNKIAAGKSVHYVSNGDWSMHDLVMELLKKYNNAEVFITTYALREFPVRQLILAQEKGDIKSIKMLLDYRAKIRTPEVFQLASMNIGAIFLTSIHAKVTVIKSPVGHVSIVGSANWTQNPRIECGVISLNEELANFHINWIEKIMINAEIFE
jgi:hypothetical protein